MLGTLCLFLITDNSTQVVINELTVSSSYLCFPQRAFLDFFDHQLLYRLVGYHNAVEGNDSSVVLSDPAIIL